jgi:predicted dithiol-disulfide oxidoreductase (DUF899 family)
MNIVNHQVVSSDLWIAERKALLAREKELTRLRDQDFTMAWVRHHNRYEEAPADPAAACCASPS